MSNRAGQGLPVVSMKGVAKSYRLYHKPMYRVMDLLGLCPPSPRYYTERAALADIDFNVWPGEKVAIIGRNGAGKSTLLKIITESIRPSAGDVTFRGRVSPLLQIGTGFHGDFTGRQNVYASLAHMGITGREAHRRFDEIVAFAELEEYIDQPTKTYSTGMGARLMFATATAIEPEVLVVDELLGVGDAYFAHKSFERMRQMCANEGTTLLLVTHDIYSALNLCERFIWIDRGRILMEGDGRTVIAAYEQSIKDQEERRLRQRNEAMAAGAASSPGDLRVVVRSRSGFALQEPLALADIELVSASGSQQLPVSEGSPAWTLQPDGNLGPVQVVDGIACRALTPYGSIFHKAEWVVAAPGGAPDAIRARWRYTGADEAELVVLGGDGKVRARAPLPSGPAWQQKQWPVHDAGTTEGAPSGAGHYGTGRIRIRAVTFTDAEGREVVSVAQGGQLGITVDFELMGDPPPSEPTFVVAFHRPGVAYGAYIHRDRLVLPEGRRFTLRVAMDALLLGSGGWLVTVGFAESDFYSRPFHPFFTVNDQWHHVIARGFELQVESRGALDASAFFLQPASIQVVASEITPTVRSARL